MLVDKYLGSYNERYFGAGHKRTTYEIESGKVTNDLFVTNAKILQDGIWSVKGGQEIIQHLSTIDGVILAVLGVERFMKSKKVSISSWVLVNFKVRANSEPILNMEKIGLSIDLLDSSIEDKNFRINICGMSVMLKFYEMRQNKTHNNGDDGGKDYFSSHLKFTWQDLVDVKFSSKESVEATIMRASSPQNYHGIGSENSRGISILEWLVEFSQLCQLLVCNYDNISRKDSQNLWMRSVEANLNLEAKELNPIALAAFGHIDKAKKLKRNSQSWSMFDMSGETDNGEIQFQGKVAYNLPKDRSESKMEVQVENNGR